MKTFEPYSVKEGVGIKAGSPSYNIVGPTRSVLSDILKGGYQYFTHACADRDQLNFVYSLGYDRGQADGYEAGLKIGRTMGPQSSTLKDYESTLRMVREELVMGGDWATAKAKIDAVLNN